MEAEVDLSISKKFLSNFEGENLGVCGYQISPELRNNWQVPNFELQSLNYADILLTKILLILDIFVHNRMIFEFV